MTDYADLELKQLDDYNCFKERRKTTKVIDGYMIMHIHLVYTVEHDNIHRAHMVADGHSTYVPLDSVWSGVVSLWYLRFVLFLAELISLDTCTVDIETVYLKAYTKEGVCFIAGRGIVSLAGYLLIIEKDLYILTSSSLRWHDNFLDCLHDMDFEPSRAEFDFTYNIYEFIDVHVDLIHKLPWWHLHLSCCYTSLVSWKN